MAVVRQVRVGDVLRLERIAVQLDPTKEYVAIGVRSFGRGLFHYGSVTGDELGSLRFFALNPRRLVISNIKGWEGAIAVSSDIDSGCIASNRFLIYEAADDDVDICWAKWFFLSEAGNELIQRASPGSADRNRTLATRRFEDLVIPLPPVDEQRRVAALMNRGAEASAQLAARIGHAEELARATQVSLASPTDEQRARGWEQAQLGEVVSPTEARAKVEPSVEYRITGVYSFGKGLIDRGPIAGAETSYKTLTRLREGDIVMSKLNGWEGAIAVVDRQFHDTYVSTEFPTFVVDRERMLPGFFRGIARSPAFWDQLDRNVRGSMVRRRRISANDFMRATIWLPSIEVQARISATIDELDDVIEHSDAAALKANALVPSLLNREFAQLA